jgi:hypothetical protein
MYRFDVIILRVYLLNTFDLMDTYVHMTKNKNDVVTIFTMQY